tara:strand:+ start:94 stop:756 length:663 start_codon:yes stop_codon:yes gene_type:complete
MAKLKDILKENFSIVGGVVSTPALNSGDGSSLTGIVEDIYGQKTEKVSAKDVQNAIREFASYSKVLQKEENLQKIAERLSTIANSARTYTVSETEDWFDKVTVNRNMKELTNLSKQFGKIAQESNSLQQRLGGLYEDMGHILGRYYEIEGDDQHDDKVEAGLEEPRAHDIEEGDYQAFFQKAMKKFGISSPDELDDEKKKKFFNYVDANYKGEKRNRLRG